MGLVDLDGDGDLDVVLIGAASGQIGIFENDGTGHFINRSATSGLPALTRGSSLAAADFDGDHDLDLFIGDYQGSNVLARNDGGLHFTNICSPAGMAANEPSEGCTWGDMNGDTRLDLYVPNYIDSSGTPRANRLYRNQGGSAFVDMGEGTGVGNSLDPTFLSTFFDYDRDGDADLYIGNDRGTGPAVSNHLFRNNGSGQFTDVTAASGTAAEVDCMGIAIGDLDRNGYQDIYVTNLPVNNGNELLMNQGNGTFVSQTVAAGVGSFRIGWGTTFLDFDNDGWLELYVCDMNAENRLYNIDGVYPAVDIAPAMAVNSFGISYCLAKGDVDGDGDLDLLVEKRDSNILLYINHEGESRRWIRFDVRGAGGNYFAIGAQVDVRSGSVWQMDEVRSGTGFKSQDELTLHFGMNLATIADEVLVHWPGGASRTFSGLATNRRYLVYPTSMLGDFDFDLDVDGADAAVFVSVLLGTDGNAEHVALADSNGDFVIDGRDIAGFVGRMSP